MSDDTPINELLRQAVKVGASDIHLTAEAAPIFRIHGRMQRAAADNLSPGELRTLLESILGPDQLARLDKLGQVDLAYGISGVGRFRINVYRQRGSLAAAIRIIPTRVPTMDELKLPAVLASLARKNNGLILVTGPTGSGKSTTLAAMLDLINGERSCHIITLEDPIEYLHKHGKSIINQREIGLDSQSFAQALRAALRQDPDVIMVGEMRDLETIAITLTAAETGHLVLATLHTMDAAQTINRVVDVFPPHQQEQIRVQLAGVLQGVVSQALLPWAGGTGRIAAFEILVATPAVRNLIREGKIHQIPSVIQTGARYGMMTMEASLRRLLETRAISDEEYQSRFGESAREAQ